MLIIDFFLFVTAPGTVQLACRTNPQNHSGIQTDLFTHSGMKKDFTIHSGMQTDPRIHSWIGTQKTGPIIHSGINLTIAATAPSA